MAQLLAVLQLAVLLLTGLQVNPQATDEQKAQALSFAVSATQIAQSYVSEHGATLLQEAETALQSPSPSPIVSPEPLPEPSPIEFGAAVNPSQSASYSVTWNDEECVIHYGLPMGVRTLDIQGNYATALVRFDGKSDNGTSNYAGGRYVNKRLNENLSDLEMLKGSYQYSVKVYDKEHPYIERGEADLLFQESGTVVYNCE